MKLVKMCFYLIQILTQKQKYYVKYTYLQNVYHTKSSKSFIGESLQIVCNATRKF